MAISASRWPRNRVLVICALLVFNLGLILNSRISVGYSRPDRSSDSQPRFWDKLAKAAPRVEDKQINGLTMNDARISWQEAHTIPQTKVLQHTAGFTVFDNLYSLNKTIYAVTDDPTAMPDIRYILSTGVPIRHGDGEVERRTPKSEHMQIISTKQARQLFGESAGRLEGVTFLNNDCSQFVPHYYHFVAELLFGIWRAYASLDPNIKPDGQTILPPPRRLLLTNIPDTEWREYTKMNELVIHSAFPSMSLENSQVWQDRSNTLKAWYFDRVVFADRGASNLHYKPEDRYPMTVFELPGSPTWFAPMRANVLEFVGFNWETEVQSKKRPVITYISRQGGHHRKLKPEDHDRLVAALKNLEKTHGYEVIIQAMEKLSRAEQLQLVGRTTIMVGVHGNGLTSLLWMKPTPQSAVMEFFKPKGFTPDYQRPAHALGIKHYGWWGSEYFTHPNLPGRTYPPGFSGQDLPIDGDAVAALIVKHLKENGA